MYASGSKKQVSKSLKNVVRLYSSFSEQVVYLLLEYLLNALDSSNLAEHLEDSQVVHNTENRQTAFDNWGSVVVKLSRIEPEILLRLTEAVLEKKETGESMNNWISNEQFNHKAMFGFILVTYFHYILGVGVFWK